MSPPDWPPRPTPAEEAVELDVAVAFMEAHGDRWPDAAVAHLRQVSETADRKTFEQWVRIVDLMEAIHLGTRH